MVAQQGGEELCSCARPTRPLIFVNQFQIAGKAVRGSERIRLPCSGVDARESTNFRLRVKWIFHSFSSQLDLQRRSRQ